MIEGRKTEEDYFNLLGMFGTVLLHIGGKIEIPFEEISRVDFSTKELKTWFDQAKNVFVYELTEAANE